jgi:hypothetical protein
MSKYLVKVNIRVDRDVIITEKLRSIGEKTEEKLLDLKFKNELNYLFSETTNAKEMMNLVTKTKCIIQEFVELVYGSSSCYQNVLSVITFPECPICGQIGNFNDINCSYCDAILIPESKVFV